MSPRLDNLMDAAQDYLYEKVGSDWTIGWDRARHRWGICYFDFNRITLSKALAEVNTDSLFWDTVYHEVAHALAGREAEHGPLWQRIVVGLGGSPEEHTATAEVLV